MTRQEQIKYRCDYCEKEFDTEEECERHEESHIIDYAERDTEEIIDALKDLAANGYGYHMFNKIVGIPAENFESLMTEAAKRLEEMVNDAQRIQETDLRG